MNCACVHKYVSTRYWVNWFKRHSSSHDHTQHGWQWRVSNIPRPTIKHLTNNIVNQNKSSLSFCALSLSKEVVYLVLRFVMLSKLGKMIKQHDHANYKPNIKALFQPDLATIRLGDRGRRGIYRTVVSWTAETCTSRPATSSLMEGEIIYI